MSVSQRTKILDAPLAKSEQGFLFDAAATGVTLPVQEVVNLATANMIAAGVIPLPSVGDGVVLGQSITVCRMETPTPFPITFAAQVDDTLVGQDTTLSHPYDAVTFTAFAGPSDGTIVWLCQRAVAGAVAGLCSLLSNGDTPGVTLIGDEFGQAIVVPLF